MNNPFLHNYHSHTKRCGHAVGEDRDYVLAAIKAGFKTLGFSDHVILPGVDQPRMRAHFDRLEEYISSVRSLQEEFKGQIDIKLGFECEFLHGHFDDYYHELLDKYGFDYLILGQHCFYDFTYGDMRWYDDLPTKQAMLNHYLYDVVTGMESGLFSYFAHPDFFGFINRRWDDDCTEIAHKICRLAEKLQMPLELNMGRTRGAARKYLFDPDTNRYPLVQFWEIVATYDIPVIVGVDAHDPKEYETSDYEAFAEILKKLNLKHVQKLDI